MWMVARYDPEDSQALVLAAKGGHNDEMHNQNDVGNDHFLHGFDCIYDKRKLIEICFHVDSPE